MRIKVGKFYVSQFTSQEKATIYMNELGYSYKSGNNFKEDRSEIWTNGNDTAYLKSTFDFLDGSSMQKGTVWQVIEF